MFDWWRDRPPTPGDGSGSPRRRPCPLVRIHPGRHHDVADSQAVLEGASDTDQQHRRGPERCNCTLGHRGDGGVALTSHQLARYVARSPEWTATVQFKPIAAGAVLVDGRESTTAARIRQHYEDAVAVEMESAGLSQAAHLAARCPVLVIRGISDRADGTKVASDAAGSQPLAVANAAAFAAVLLRAMATAVPPRTNVGAHPETARHQQVVFGAPGGITYAVQNGDQHIHQARPCSCCAGREANGRARPARAPGSAPAPSSTRAVHGRLPPQEIRDQAQPGRDAISLSTRGKPMLVVTTSSLRRVATTCGWSCSSMNTRTISIARRPHPSSPSRPEHQRRTPWPAWCGPSGPSSQTRPRPGYRRPGTGHGRRSTPRADTTAGRSTRDLWPSGKP